jgi:hypothetical protein
VLYSCCGLSIQALLIFSNNKLDMYLVIKRKILLLTAANLNMVTQASVVTSGGMIVTFDETLLMTFALYICESHCCVPEATVIHTKECQSTSSVYNHHTSLYKNCAFMNCYTSRLSASNIIEC